MAPGKPKGGKGGRSDGPMLPSVRSLAKSSSAPTNEQGWLAKIGSLFKSLSNLDSSSRDRAADDADRSSMQQQRFPPARQLVVGMSAQRTANPRLHVGNHQQHAPGGVSPKLAPLGANRPRLSPADVAAATVGQQHQGLQQLSPPPRLPSPRPSRLESLKRMVSGMFQRHTPAPADPVDHSLRAQLQQPMGAQLQPRTSLNPPTAAHTEATSARTTPAPAAAAAAAAATARVSPQVVAVQPAFTRPQPVRLPEAPSSSSVVRDSNSALTTMSTSPASTATAATAAAAAAAAATSTSSSSMQQGSNLLAVSEHLPPAMVRRVWQIDDYCDLEQIHAGYASYVFKAKCR